MTLLQPLVVVPHVLPCSAQVRGVQAWPRGPQTLGVPPPPQTPTLQAPPQSMRPPQPSGAMPQLAPAGQAVSGVQQTLAVPSPAQTAPPAQAPQATTPAQPSLATPHSMPDGHDVVLHDRVPHTLAPPPPQMGASAGQLVALQWSMPPQRSEATPQPLATHAVKQAAGSPPSTALPTV